LRNNKETTICRICNKEFKKTGLKYHLTHSHFIEAEVYYKHFIMEENEDICKMYGSIETCKKYKTFISLSNGYPIYCSLKCMTNDQDVKDKKVTTNFERYGVNNPNKLSSVKQKIKESNLAKFGVEYPIQLKEKQELRKENTLRKYGVENISQLEEIKQKKRETCFKNFGVENPGESEKVKEKIKETMVERYGVENAANSESIKEKKRQTNLKKYGVEYPGQSEEFKEKMKKTSLKNYGVEYPSQSKVVLEKVRQTNLNRYGIEWNINDPEIRRKMNETRLKTFTKKLHKVLEYLDIELIGEYKNTYSDTEWKCKKCNSIFASCWFNIQQGHCKCPFCFPSIPGGSKLENEISDYVSSLIGANKIQKNCWDVIKNPKSNRKVEIDIFIPDLKIAIEFDGLYWHSELRLPDNDYHLIKTEECEKQGIKLIHIFEDEWIFKQDIVKERLKQILNINNKERIHGRKCNIQIINSKTKNKFLEKYHIQGPDKSIVKLGAFHNNKLVSVMTFAKGNISKGSKSIEGVWELNRFCSDYNFHIPGIASKLLTHFKRNYEWKEIFSYADRRWSQGNLYHKLDFELDSITKINYWYLKGYDRIHRFNLRKRPDEPKDIPEWVLRDSEGYTRIWDCGSLKFKLANL